jgi:hypothetical protein
MRWKTKRALDSHELPEQRGFLNTPMEVRNREIGKERGAWGGEGNHLI